MNLVNLRDDIQLIILLLLYIFFSNYYKCIYFIDFVIIKYYAYTILN
jgi:hypothetical protein